MRLGHPNTRDRKWAILRHKTKTSAFRSPLSQFAKRFHRACNYSFREYLIASKEEQGDDIKWARARPTSKARLLDDDATIDP